VPRLQARGLGPGRDIFVAFSPERLDPGNRRHTLRTIPKVVGGLTPTCTRLVTTLYRRIIDQVVPVSGPATAEMVKLLENTFRAVNIALANEFAIMCRRLGISVWEVIQAAATKPFGFMPFYPGPGLGGHCLPSDPHYLSWRVRLEGYEPRFIGFADEINRHMPEYVVQLVVEALNDRERAVRGARLLVLGVAYKANVADIRDSPALEIIGALMRRGARVAYHDPLVPSVAVQGTKFESIPWPDPHLGVWDAVLILTGHAGYDWAGIVRDARLVIDTRNVTAGLQTGPHVIRL
jgi:UDP-N-acetyl-D-glucosamine dehydrogenase